MFSIFGNNKDNLANIGSLFSQRPENKAAAKQTNALTGPAVNFMTDFFAGEPQQGTTAAIRHQAEYDPEEKLWYLVELSHFDGGAFANMFVPKTVEKTKNIFDALHWCSEFQAASEEKLQKRKVNPGKEYNRGFKHWRDIAKEMNLPIAENGILIPPQKGRMIPDGHYKGEQIAAAYQITPITNPIETISHYNNALAKGNTFKSDFEIMRNRNFQEPLRFCGQITTSTLKASVLSGVASILYATLHVSTLIANDIAHEFNYGVYFSTAMSIFLLGPAAQLGYSLASQYTNGDPELSPERCLKKRCADFNKAAALLPDPEDRALCQEFANQAAFTFWTGRAQTIYERKTEAGQSPKEGFACLDKAADAIGLDDGAREKLKRFYMAAGLDKGKNLRLKNAGQTPVSWDDVERQLKNSALKLAA